MISLRKSDERGHFDFGWLDTRHTFSFGDYYDEEHMGFRDLRVINDDLVKPGKGFPTHGHRDMEIVTVVLEGALEHKDSLGTGSVIRPGEVQRMSAGTGVTHSEFNSEPGKPLHLLQIWILPERRGLAPSYEQRAFPEDERRGRLRLLVSPDGRDGSLRIHQKVELFGALLSRGETVVHELARGRHAWLQIARGKMRVNENELSAGDGAALSDETLVSVQALEDGEILLFDLA